MKFSLVLPAYNEADKLENTVSRVLEVIERHEVNFEIIIAEDGSTDGTDEIARSLSNQNDKIIHLHSDEKLGRGKALRRAFKEAKGEFLGYIDVDLAVSPKYLPELLYHVEENDVVTGSRYLEGSRVDRPLLREIFSRAYNWLIRVLLGCEVSDSQCGFKAFSKSFVENEIMDIEENSWAWDTVVVVRALKKGYSYEEFPVEWKEKRESGHSASIERILGDIRLHGGVIYKLFLKWKLKRDVEI